MCLSWVVRQYLRMGALELKGEGLDGWVLYNMHWSGKNDRKPPGEGGCRAERGDVCRACGRAAFGQPLSNRNAETWGLIAGLKWSHTGAIGPTRPQIQRWERASPRQHALCCMWCWVREEWQRAGVHPSRVRNMCSTDTPWQPVGVWGRAGRLMKSPTGDYSTCSGKVWLDCGVNESNLSNHITNICAVNKFACASCTFPTGLFLRFPGLKSHD